MKKYGASMNSTPFLSRMAAVPKDPQKTQELALKRAVQPKQAHKLVKPRKLKGSVNPIPPKTLRG